jgi:broad specificity phosphatase PhoE
VLPAFAGRARDEFFFCERRPVEPLAWVREPADEALPPFERFEELRDRVPLAVRDRALLVVRALVVAIRAS